MHHLCALSLFFSSSLGLYAANRFIWIQNNKKWEDEILVLAGEIQKAKHVM